MRKACNFLVEIDRNSVVCYNAKQDVVFIY